MSVKELVLLSLRWIPVALSSLMCQKDSRLPCCLPFFHGQQNRWASCLLLFLDPPRRALRKRSRRWEGSSSCITDVDPSGLPVSMTNFFIISCIGEPSILNSASSKINLRTPKGSWFLKQEQVLVHKSNHIIFNIQTMQLTLISSHYTVNEIL